MKLCKDCKFFEPHPNKNSPLHNCHLERFSYRSCGKDAKFFEPINQSESEVKSKSFWQRLFNF